MSKGPSKQEQRLSRIYYSPNGYWKGLTAAKKLARAARVPEEVAERWLRKHQADLTFLTHDRVGGKLWKYALTVVDIGSRFKEAEPLSTKDSGEVASAFEKIYKRSPLKWPKFLQVDPEREFMGAVSRVTAKHGTAIRRGHPGFHRDQGIVERFNRTLAERLFRHQNAIEMHLPRDQRSVVWVRRPPGVVAALNNEVTRLTKEKPVEAIKQRSVFAEPATAPYRRPAGAAENRLPPGLEVRFFFNLESWKEGCKGLPTPYGR